MIKGFFRLSRGPLKSGSKVVEEEFLLLKTTWPKVPPTNRWQVQAQLGLEAQFCKATEYLESIQAFNDYLVAIRNGTPSKDSAVGVFWHPYEQQHRWCVPVATVKRRGTGEGLWLQ